MLLDPRNGPAWDLSPPPALRRTYVVASTPRVGSTLLCRSLWDVGLVGAPKEYLNPMQLRDWEVRLGTRLSALRHRPLSGAALALVGRLSWHESHLQHHLERVMQRRTSATGWFGLKLHAHHHRRWFGDGPMPPLLNPIHWIRVVREDRLAQAVSWERALQTGRWASHQRETSATPRYSRYRIERRLRAIERDELWWDAVLEQESVLLITYEQLRRRRAQAVREVLAHLNVPGAASLGVSDAALEKQADGVNATWVQRFRAGG